MARKLAMAAALAALAAPGAAHAAGPGDVIRTGDLPLPAGAIAGSDGGRADGEPTTHGVSGDGRYVAFASDADTLSPDAHPDVTHIYRKDRSTGEVVLVSRATGAAGAPQDRYGAEVTISDDGDRVAWVTRAALDPADTDGGHDVYVREISSATTLLATPDTTDSIYRYDLSGNGDHVAFETTTGLAGAADVNGVSDVYRRALGPGTTALVSRQAGAALAGDAASTRPSISDDGRWVAFASAASNLVVGFADGGAARDVFARDMTAGVTYLISCQFGAPVTGANASSDHPQIAGTPGAAIGTVYVAFDSDATNLAGAGVDTSDQSSVYRRRLSLAFSTLVSRANGVAGANADSRAGLGDITDSGAVVAFMSDADNLGAGDDYYGSYVRDLGAGTTELASADNEYAVWPAISDDGSVIAWFDGSGGFTPDSDPGVSGVFARVSGGAPEYISRPPGSAPFLAPATMIESAGTGARAISADGRYVVFAAYSPRLPGNSSSPQVYRRDTVTGALDLVSRAGGADGAPADRASSAPSISADGTRVAFRTSARLDPTDTDDLASVYVRDLAAATTTLVSRADGQAGALPDAHVDDPRISAGGGHVVFTTDATTLGTAGGDHHVYVRDLGAGRTQLVDRATGGGGATGNDDAEGLSLSGDGRLVAFASRANNIDPADPSTMSDVYVRDTVAETTQLVSRRSGLDGAKAAGSSWDAVISTDGRVVAFEADDDTLAPEGGAWGGSRQVVARDLASGQNTLVSRGPGGVVADASAHDPSISADGSVVAFSSTATNLLGGVGGSVRPAVFARTMATGALSGPPAFGLVDNSPQNGAWGPSLSDDGRCLAFAARGHNAFTGPAGDVRTGYVYVIDGNCPSPAAPAGAGDQSLAKPVISDASLKHKTFRVGKKKTAKRAVLARRRPAGTKFRFTLSTDADLAIVLKQKKAGRRSGGKCRKPTPKLRKRRACTRYVKRGKLVRTGLTAKRHKIAFSGRVGRKAMKPGRYKAILRARNAAGSSKPVSLKFRIVRR